MSLPFTPEELNTAIAEGRVTERPHPTLPLYIYNYAPETQYKNDWDEVTLTCRGLILNEQGEIIARPWKKFFNLGQVDLPIQFDDPVEVMDKADGSLGILYYGDGHFSDFRIATRGSFASPQAEAATRILKNKYMEWCHAISRYKCGDICCDHYSGIADEFTFLFEIIYPSNRIVLDYGEMEDLILLGVVETQTGNYYGPGVAVAISGWTGPVVEVMPHKTLSEAIGHSDRKNAEGYVIRSHNFMVKVKQPDYVELHRLVTNASPKTVWEQLKLGKSKIEIVSAFPDEFHDYIGSMADPLIDVYDERGRTIMAGYFDAMNEVGRKFGLDANRAEIASVLKKRKDARYYFLLFDERSISDVLWSELKPTAE